MKKNEAFIRDALSTRLDLLEPGLQLLDIEKYLPNPHGTRGFVDLFARDQNGKYVLIELKRSDASSRQAMHEILKYVEAIKLNLSARDAEIRVFIVSTEWKELLVPFSSLVNRTSIEVIGFNLAIDSATIPTAAERVNPLNLNEDRLFAPWHELNLYKNKSSFENGLRTYEESCTKKGIENYVIIVLTPSDGLYDSAEQSMMSSLNSINKNKISSEAFQDLFPKYEFMIYFACLQLDEALCWEIIKIGVEKEDLEEFKSYVAEMDDTARLCTLHEKAYEAKPKIKRDYYEIGYPAKFGNKILDDEGWTIQEIRRYGSLNANELLTDETIVNDLRGADGNSQQKYNRQFNPCAKSELNEVRLGLQRCLKDNPLWKNQLTRVVDDYLPKVALYPDSLGK